MDRRAVRAAAAALLLGLLGTASTAAGSWSSDHDDGTLIVRSAQKLDRALPDDPLFGAQYGLANSGQDGGKPGADVAATAAWPLFGLGSFPRRKGARVAIIDTGIAKHPDLAGQVAACAEALSATGRRLAKVRSGTCADDDGHGTIMAGIVAARVNNAVGVAGLAFDARLLICRAFGKGGHGKMGDAAKCVAWARTKHADVILISAGGNRSDALADAISTAWDGGGAGGTLVVAASGNDGSTRAQYPASLDEVVSVGATDRRDRHASFSNHNADVEISAPGSRIVSTTRRGRYAMLSGTSAAAAYVAGAAALIAQRRPDASAARWRAMLDEAVDDRGPSGRDPFFGFGRLDLCKAARLAADRPAEGC